MRFPVGSKVKLAGYTSDDQIDDYIGRDLIVLEYREIPYEEPFERGRHGIIPNYDLLTPDNIVITANEHELEAV